MTPACQPSQDDWVPVSKAMFFIFPTGVGRVWGLCVVSVLWDLAGAAIAGGNTAHWAHIGGLVCGALLGLLFLGTGWVILSCFDNRSLFEMLTGRELKRSEDEVEASAA